MLRIDESTVRRLLPMEKAVSLLEEAFAGWRGGTAINQPRRRMRMPGGAVLHSLAGATEKYFGTKVYSTHPRHGAWFHFLLYDGATAQPLALFDANWLGQIRTGAASGLATKWMARPEAATVAVLGAGFQAASQLEAVRTVRPIRRSLVWSRSAERREAFAKEHECEPVSTAEEAVAQADIVVTMTSAREPLFAAPAARPGTHVNAAGSNIAAHAEIPAELVRCAGLLAADSVEQARIEAGDFIRALDESGWSRVQELRDAPQRTDPEQITIFKSVGLGLEDTAVAAYVYEQCAGAG